MNVLILEDSKAIAARLVETIMEIDGIEHILYAPTFDKPINLVLSDKVDIVLCGIALTNENVAKLAELQAVYKPLSFIILFRDILPDYIKKHPGLSVDYFLDTSKELEKLPETIIGVMRALNKTPKMNLS